jgi:cytochrome oxidase Cu insertion factor (SCO1/SenC/PrrC family)
MDSNIIYEDDRYAGSMKKRYGSKHNQNNMNQSLINQSNTNKASINQFMVSNYNLKRNRTKNQSVGIEHSKKLARTPMKTPIPKRRNYDYE